MIKFFRRIRQRLLSENLPAGQASKISKPASPVGRPASRTGRYLLYAIGEILLVVIGILIALQINNLNDNRKNKNLETKYLYGILENLNEDIKELDNLFKKDIKKLNDYTILTKAFTDKNIRYDTGLLKTAILGSFGTHNLNSNRIIFDDMKFSGKVNLIQSDNLRKSIMTYYNTAEDLLEAADKTNNWIFEFYDKGEIGSKIHISTLAGSAIEDKWKGLTYDFDDSFFDKDIREDQVKKFSQNLTALKNLIKINHDRRLRLNAQAIQLKNQINEYLGIEVEIGTKDESISFVEKDDFIPSSPENLIPITHEELSAYEGNYQVVKSSNDAFTDIVALVEIYREGNHLIIHNLIVNSYSSFYATANDQFIYAYSFLFDDELSQATIQFGRDSNDQVNELIIKGWYGIYEFKKISQ